MSVTVLLMSLVVEQLWVVLPGSPYFGSAQACGITFLIMVLGGLIAFLMVWVEFKVILETSALTFMVAGVFKELVTGGRPHLPQGGFPCSDPLMVIVLLKLVRSFA